MIVQKFGGTSVANAQVMDKVLDLALREIDRAPLLVASAMSKVTDTLISIRDNAVSGSILEAQKEIEALHTRHRATAEVFLSGEILEAGVSALDKLIEELSGLVRGLFLLRECTLRSSDAVVSFGERLSTTLLFYRARERGMDCEFLDAREVLFTTEEFTNATPIYSTTNQAIQERVKPRAGHLIITQGFIGRTLKGVTTTLGRGGSDFSATIFGAALKAEEVQIWTDVDGIMSCDPRIIPEAHTVESISYEEAAELAYFGAKVVHPSTIQPAVELGIPVLVKNTNNPDGKGTVIKRIEKKNGLLALAGKKRVILININSSRMLNAYGFVSRIFNIFEKHKTPVDLIATSEVSVSVTIDNPENLERIVQDLSEIGSVSAEPEKSILCLVGRGLWRDPVFLSRVFKALGDVPVRMISLGSSDINLSLVLSEKMLDNALKNLHREFFN